MKKLSIGLFVFCSVFLMGCSGDTDAKTSYDAFAQCLAENGWKLYGSFRCSHCADQKAAFGDAVKYIEWVECDEKAPNNESALCRELRVDAYPTWVGPNDERLVGYRPLEQLAEETGCELE